MTFDKVKNKLDKMSINQHEKTQVILAKLYKKIVKNDSTTANALELASMALMLYTNGGK